MVSTFGRLIETATRAATRKNRIESFVMATSFDSCFWIIEDCPFFLLLPPCSSLISDAVYRLPEGDLSRNSHIDVNDLLNPGGRLRKFEIKLVTSRDPAQGAGLGELESERGKQPAGIVYFTNL
jgi:hypothetical protein